MSLATVTLLPFAQYNVGQAIRGQTFLYSLTHEFTPSLVSNTKLSFTRNSVDQSYKNFVLVNINNHCVRLAVMQGEFRWHQHPRSDECFLVVEGELEIDLADGRTFRLKPGEVFTIPAGVIHRTRSHARAVNLCFEDRNAYTDVVFEDSEKVSK